MSGPWERRWHPLLDEWVIISSSSAVRPWSGARSDGKKETTPEHDPSCFLCPRVVRANLQLTPPNPPTRRINHPRIKPCLPIRFR